jgi:hypothetical protein
MVHRRSAALAPVGMPVCSHEQGVIVNAKDVIKTALDSNRSMLTMYLSDLSDADLLVRPAPGANHIAWQLGHLIGAEANFVLPTVPGAAVPQLPAGFAEKHAKETAGKDSPADFYKKEEYLALLSKVREATLAALAKIPDAELDKPTSGRVAQIAPNIGALFLLCATHDMMHGGQFTVVRRKLGKPVLF